MFAFASDAPAAFLKTSGDTLINNFGSAWSQIQSHALSFLVTIAVLVFGYIAARLVAKATTKVSEKIGLQNAAEHSGLAQSMQQVGIRRSVPAILGTIVFWLLMCVFVTTAFNILGLEKLSAAMTKLTDYIPSLLVATVVIVVGLLVASFLRGVVATSADRVGLSYAQSLANVSYYVLALVTFMVAFKQLGLEIVLLDNLILIACGGLALGFGLSFGLGGRDVMAGILAGYYIRQRLQAGDHVKVAGMEGTVREVGPVATLIETDEAGLLNRHSVPNVKMLNEAVR